LSYCEGKWGERKVGEKVYEKSKKPHFMGILKEFLPHNMTKTVPPFPPSPPSKTPFLLLQTHLQKEKGEN